MEEKADILTYSLNQLFNDKAVYRTAPATPGLLNVLKTNCNSVQKRVKNILSRILLCLVFKIFKN